MNTWHRVFFLVLLVLLLTAGVLFTQNVVLAQISFGGKVMAITTGPPPFVGPCAWAAPFCYVISPPNPAVFPGVSWLAPFPPPPIGAWVLGWGIPTAIIIGGWGF